MQVRVMSNQIINWLLQTIFWHVRRPNYPESEAVGQQNYGYKKAAENDRKVKCFLFAVISR